MIGVRGTPLSAGGGVLEVSVTSVRVWPGLRWTAVAPRSLELTVPDVAVIDPKLAGQILSPTRRALASRQALALTVFAAPATATADVLRGDPGALVVDRVQVAAGASVTRLAPTGP